MLRTLLLKSTRLHFTMLYTDVLAKPTLPYFYNVNTSLISKYHPTYSVSLEFQRSHISSSCF